MHEWLAEAYGTGADISDAPQQDDVEKLAQAEILDQMFQAEEVDWSQLDAETVEKIASELFGEDNQITAEELTKAAEEGEPQTEDEFNEKFAEADFAGRVMAHSFNQELESIEMAKEAKGGKIMEGLRRAGKAVGEWTGASGAAEAHRLAGQAGKEHKQLTRGIQTLKARGDKATQSTRSLARSARKAKGEEKVYKGVRGEYLKQLGTRVGLPAAGLAAAGGGGYAAAKALGKKKESALDTLAEQRAMEILEQNGYTFDDGQDQDKLASAVEQRAYEMLYEAGFIEEE